MLSMRKMVNRFQTLIWDFYHQNKRSLSWRETTNPYNIMVSEVMLQQTQVSRVLERYLPFIAQFPTLEDLAEANLTDVLRVWTGLGYNRRALYLKQTAVLLTKKYHTIIPSNPTILTTLPGIGPATAGAIVVYAYNQPCVFIETNIRRAFLHQFFPDRENVHDREIIPLIEQTLDHSKPREWYWALMDYGANLAKLAKNPNTRSAHYTKQSKFEGSVRQLRGRIVRQLITSTPQPLTNLQALHDYTTVRFQEALLGLERDGIIKTVGKRVYFVQEA